MKSFIVGTAGHIDHGKSALVAALTGKDPDRLPEEKRRGITIDLGFADMDLGDARIGFVDVPGHERFVKNMLAGAHGLDAVALVIAADEGVMPQTREHFDICRLLGVNTGLVVITKADLVEEELAELVREEVAELVSGSFLEDAPVVIVSAKTGAGLDQLKKILNDIAKTVPAKDSRFVPRLPIDRAFTMKGFGAVVTGTLVSGHISEGDELELMPPQIRVRARGVQVHGQSVSRASAGQRTAVNLGGVEVAALERGMILSPVGRLRTSQVLDVQVDVLPSAARALRSRSRVRLHIHAAEVLGRIRILNESGAIEAGESGFAQLRLESPVVAVRGERFIIRSYSPSQTVAGGQVLDPFAVKHRGREFARVRSQLKTLAVDNDLETLSTFVSIAGDAGQTVQDLAARTGWNDQELRRALADATVKASIVDCEGVFIDRENFTRLSATTVDDVKVHHEREPLSKGLAREMLRERRFSHAPHEVFRSVVASLERSGTIVADKDVLRSSEHQLEVKGADADLKNQIASVYDKSGLEPPTLTEALQKSGASNAAHGRKLLQLLIDSGELVRLQGDLLFHKNAINQLKLKLKAFGDQHEPDRLIDVPTFKDLAGVSRKYAIPLLEYFDRERMTKRAGDRRIILK